MTNASESSEKITQASLKRPTLPVDLFRIDMLVNHPQYGDGRIIGLSGTGKKRIAQIEFFSGHLGKFLLAFCGIKPIEETDS